MITATRLVRPMRGRSRSVCLSADGWHYVVKPPSIGHRALLSEWLGARLLSMLGILAADVQPMVVPASLARQCWPQEHHAEDVIAAASSYPVDPQRTAVYDFLPPAFTAANADHLAGVLAVDLWTGRRQPRQHVFYRQGPWWACAIDHKDCFGLSSPDAEPDPANPALRHAYPILLGQQSCLPFWLEQIARVRLSVVEEMLDSAPECWREPAAVEDLRRRIAALAARRQGLADRVQRYLISELGLTLHRAIA